MFIPVYDWRMTCVRLAHVDVWGVQGGGRGDVLKWIIAYCPNPTHTKTSDIIKADGRIDPCSLLGLFVTVSNAKSLCCRREVSGVVRCVCLFMGGIFRGDIVMSFNVVC